MQITKITCDACGKNLSGEKGDMCHLILCPLKARELNTDELDLCPACYKELKRMLEKFFTQYAPKELWDLEGG